MAEHLSPTASDGDVDPTILTLDRNFEYSIWLSYAEVYNERVYDLLETVKDDTTAGQRPGTASGSHPLFLTRKALQLRPCLPSDDSASTTPSGKYISGLRQFRVQTASQAKALVKLGQIHRRVFGTLANRESSRSHAMVIIKVVRGHSKESDVRHTTLGSLFETNVHTESRCFPSLPSHARRSCWL
jgi:kinesin family member 20